MYRFEPEDRNRSEIENEDLFSLMMDVSVDFVKDDVEPLFATHEPESSVDWNLVVISDENDTLGYIYDE